MIGAGVVGISAAIALQGRGLAVRVIDVNAPGTGCSFGNAGVIGPSIIPLSASYGLAKLPRIFLSRTSPASLDLASLPGLVRWGLHYARATGATRARRDIETLHEICPFSYSAWQRLAGERFSEVPKIGYLTVFLQGGEAGSAAPTLALRRSLGVRMRELDASSIAALEPMFAGIACGGLLMEEAGHVRNPHAFVTGLSDLFLARGGEIVRDRVVRVRSLASGEVLAEGEAQDYRADSLVIAAGAHCNALLKGLGHRIPLISERGYHWEVSLGGADLGRSVLLPSLGAVLTPSDAGARLAGLSQFGMPGFAARPRLIEELLTRLRAVLPHVAGLSDHPIWSGERPTTPDSIPVIERVPGQANVYLNTGHGHGGLTMGASSAFLLTELMSGRVEPLHDKLSSRRF